MKEVREYRDFEELSQYETENIDFRIVKRFVPASAIGAIAPHGGKIEFLTSELADSIAGEDHNFYGFEGIKAARNGRLHITSTNFDEPQALALIANCKQVVALHGFAGDGFEVQVGGRDEELMSRVHEALQAAGFASEIVTSGPYGGSSVDNICNRGASRAGVQLELRAGLRNILKTDSNRFDDFVGSIRTTLGD